jgi:hypothetical protein
MALNSTYDRPAEVTTARAVNIAVAVPVKGLSCDGSKFEATIVAL